MMKIYFNQVEISLVTDNNSHSNCDLVINVLNDEILSDFIMNLHNNEYDQDICLITDDCYKLMSNFMKHYNFIEAAGGIVMNDQNNFLLIKRLGVWDLPKGKKDKGESNEEAAIREVCEETGLVDVEIVGKLPHTFHIYLRKNRWYLKKTYWYSMMTNEKTELVPQEEEDISEARWMNRSDARNAIKQSYRSILEVLGSEFEM